MTDYSSLLRQIRSLTDGYDNAVGNLANVSSLLYHALPDVSWVGFYLLRNGVLELSPFQGKIACMSIPVGKGVCGCAVRQNETLLVPNVHLFPGHIACDSESNSEIVVVLRKDGVPVGVLDIDSTSLSRFDETDKAGLELLAEEIEKLI